jgi:hypothetical protein
MQSWFWYKVLLIFVFLFYFSLVLSITRALHVEDLGGIDESVNNGVSYSVVSKNLVEFPKIADWLWLWCPIHYHAVRKQLGRTGYLPEHLKSRNQARQ